MHNETKMSNIEQQSSSSDSEASETTTQLFRESHSQIGLSNNINQSTCLDSAFEFPLILPRVFLPTASDELRVKAMEFIGTCHFLHQFVLKFLFNRSSVETFKKQKQKSSYSELCYTSSLTSWQELDSYYNKVGRMIKLDNALSSLDDIEIFLHRARNFILNPLLRDIKDKKFDSPMLGLCCLTLTYTRDSDLSSPGHLGMPLLSKNRIREMCKKRSTIKHIKVSSGRSVSVKCAK